MADGIKKLFTESPKMGSMQNYKKIINKNDNFVGVSLLTNVSDPEKAMQDFILDNKESKDAYCYNLVTDVAKLKGFIGKDCNVYPRKSIKLSETEYLILTEKVDFFLSSGKIGNMLAKFSIVEKFDIIFKYMDMFIALHSENKDSKDLSYVHHRIQPSNLFVIDQKNREVGVFLQSKLSIDRKIETNFPRDKFLYAAPENWKVDNVDREVLAKNGFTNIDNIYKGNIVSGVEGDVYSLSVTLMVFLSSEQVIFKGLDKACLDKENLDKCLTNLSKNIHEMMEANYIEALASPFETAIVSLPHNRYQTMKLFKQNVLFIFCAKMFNEKVVFGVLETPKNHVRQIGAVTDPKITDAQKDILNTLCIKNYQESMANPLRVLV